ncbi:hypothetical protein ACIOZM_15000 [Pseudomonas sp. NPDC087346]|uniref:hypothetical protein n=1 Tax=Pseudomonas sp. NPDC087346 TaxID=3364438 RepID=UPI0038276F91
MTKQVLYNKATGEVLQWQDADQFSYASPTGAMSVLKVTESQWERQSALRWVVNNSLSTSPPLLPEVPPTTKEEVEAVRLRAYAEPLTGSDRYFAEAQRMQLMGEDGWEAIRAEGVVRFKAIQAEFPWPESASNSIA